MVRANKTREAVSLQLYFFLLYWMIATSDQEHKIQYKNIFKIKIQYNHANASISYLGYV